MLLAQAYRNPSMAERFIKFEQGGGLRFLPNPNLKSEKLVASLELGTNWSIDESRSLDVAVFYNRYNNLISFEQRSQPLEPLLYQVVNLKEAVMQGVELTFHQRWGNYANMTLGYTYLDASDVSIDRFNDELAYKVRHTFSASASAYLDAFTFHVNSRYRSAIQEVFIYPGSEPEAAFILNSKVTWQATDKGQVYFALDNLTDTQYEELERYRMPGRRYSMGVVWNF